jgi:hypothetical protein
LGGDGSPATENTAGSSVAGAGPPPWGPSAAHQEKRKITLTKLNQILAIEKGAKAQVKSVTDRLYVQIQKTGLWNGFSKTYHPFDDEDTQQRPQEGVIVQVSGEDVLQQLSQAMGRLMDLTATKAIANTLAKADVVVDGEVVLEAVPVSQLLDLEKMLVDLATILGKLPTLDPTEDWHFDQNRGLQVTDPVFTVASKKVPKNHVKAPATDKHPAQVEVYPEDVPVGRWYTTKFSGAFPASRVKQLKERVEKLKVAVKFAREEANSVTITDAQYGAKVFGYLLAE